MTERLLVPGHTLVNRGRSFLDGQLSYAECSCGAVSTFLPSTRARQRWHRAHREMMVKAVSVDAVRADLGYPPLEIKGATDVPLYEWHVAEPSFIRRLLTWLLGR